MKILQKYLNCAIILIDKSFSLAKIADKIETKKQMNSVDSVEVQQKTVQCMNNGKPLNWSKLQRSLTFLGVFAFAGVLFYILPAISHNPIFAAPQAFAASCTNPVWSVGSAAPSTAAIATTGKLLGAFKDTCGTTTANNSDSVTSISITISNATGITNLKLFTDQVTNCTTTNPSTQTGSTITNPATGTAANVFGSLTGNTIAASAFRCFYVVADIGTAAANGSTIAVSINAVANITESIGTHTLSATPLSLGTTTMNRSVSISQIGTQTTTASIPTTNFFVGGAFTLTDTASDGQTVTSIGVTVNSTTGLSNMKLYTDTVASCSTANPVANATQLGSTSGTVSSKTTFSSLSSSVTSTSRCIYVVVDVGTGAGEGQTLDISIAASGDVVASSGLVSGTGAVAGSTTLSRVITVGTTGTQTSSVVTSTTAFFVGGAFTMSRSDSSTAVTTIKVTIGGTVTAAELANMKVYTDTVASCTTTSGFSSQYGSTVTSPAVASNTFTGSVSVGTGTTCVYVVLDITSSGVAGHTLEISINASGDVTPTAGTIGGTFAVSVAGTTTVNAAPINISGACKLSDGSTNCADSLTVSVAINGTLQAQTASTSSGTYTISNVTAPTAGLPIVVFISGVSAKGATYTRAAGSSNITGLDIYQSTLILRAEDAGPITNANINTYDSTQDSTNLKFTADSNNLSVLTGQKLIVWTGKTFTPGGTVTTTAASTSGNPDGDLTVQSSATLSMSTNALSVGGDFTNSGTWTGGTQTTTFTATGSGFIFDPGSSNPYSSVTFGGSGGTYTLTNTNLSVASILTISTGATLNGGTGRTITLSASGTPFSRSGTFTGGTSLVKFTSGSGITALSSAAMTTTNAFYDLEIAGTGTFTEGQDVTMSHNLTVTSGTLSGSNTVIVNGSVAGAGTITVTGTFKQTVAAAQNFGAASGSVAWSFSNLTFSNSSGSSNTITTQTGGTGGITISGTLTIGESGDTGATVLDPGNRTWNLTNITTPMTILASPAGSLCAPATCSGNTSVFNFDPLVNGSSVTVPGTNYVTLTLDNTNDATGTANAFTLGGNTTVSGQIKLGNVNSTNADTLNASSFTLNLSGSGSGATDPLCLINAFCAGTKGTFIASTSTVRFTGSSATSLRLSNFDGASIVFNNLEFSPGGTATFTLPGIVIAGGNLVLGDGSHSGTITSATNNSEIHVKGNVTINANTTYIKASTAAFSFDDNYTSPVTSDATFTDNTATPQNIGALSIALFHHTVTLGSSMTVDTLSILAGNRTFDMTNGGYTLKIANAGATADVLNTNGGIFTAGTSTVNFTATNSGGSINIPALAYSSLQLSGAETYVLTGNLTTSNAMTGSLAIGSGATLDTTSGSHYDIDIGDDFTNAGTFTANSGTVTFSNSSNTSTLTGATNFYNFTVQTPDKQVRFTAGQTFGVSGALTLAGTSGHVVNINSTTGSSSWTLNFTGTSDVYYTQVTYSACQSSSPTIDMTTNPGDVDGGNNGACWSFASGMTISGFAYSAEGSGALASKTIAIKIDGSGSYSGVTAGDGSYSINGITATSGQVVTVFIDNATENATTVTIASTGNISGLNLYQNRVIVRYETGSSITNTNLDQYDDTNGGSDGDVMFGVTSGNLTLNDGAKLLVWTGMTFAPGGTVTTSANNNSTTVDGDIGIQSGATFNMAANALSVGGDFVNAGTFSESASPHTTTFTATVTGNTIDLGTGNFENVTFNGSAGGWSFSDSDNTIGGDLTITAGTLSGTTNLTVSGGDVTGAGTLNLTGGLLTVDGSGSFGSSSDWTTSSLSFTGSSSTTTGTGAGGVTVTGVLTIGASHTLDAASKTWTLSGTSTPFVKTGSFTPNASTFNFTGNGASTILATTYYNLGLKPSSSSQQVLSGGALVVGGVLTVGDGTNQGATGSSNNPTVSVTGNTTVAAGATFTPGSAAETYSGDLTVDGLLSNDSTTLTITASGNVTGAGTISLSQGGSFEQRVSSNKNFGSTSNANVWQLGNLTFSNSNGGATPATISTQSGGSGVINLRSLTIGGASDVGGATTTFKGSSRTWDIGILTASPGCPSASPFTINATGVFTPETSTMNYECTASKNIAATTYYNLGLGTVSDSNASVTGTLLGNTTVTNDLTIGNGSSTNADILTTSGSNYSLTVGGNMVITAKGSLTGNASAISVGGNWTVTTGGAFTANTSTVTFSDTSGTKTITSAGTSFNNVTFNGSGDIWQPQDSMTVAGDIVITAGTLSGTNNVTVSGGDVTGAGTLNLTGGLLTVDGSGSFGSSSDWTTSSLSFTGSSSTTTGTGAGGVTVTGVLTIGASHTLDAASKTWTLSGTSTPFVVTGTFTPNASTFQYTGSTATVTVTTFKNLTLGGSGTYTLPASTWHVNGNLVITNGATITKGAGTLSLSGGTTQTITDSNTTKQDLGTLQISTGAGATTVQLGSSIKITAVTIDSSQTLSLNGANTLTLTGNTTPLTATGTFTPSTGTVDFSSASTTGTTIPALTYYNLTMNKASNTFTAAGTMTVNNLTLSAGTFVAPSGTLTVTGDFTNNGTFTHNSGTVAITPTTSSSVTGTTATTFQNLSISAPDKTVLFKAGQTVTVAGTLTLAGTSGHNLTIGSTVNSSTWTIVVTGSFSMNYLAVSDSICGGGTDFTQNSTIVNLGNNGSCWHFTIRGGSTGGGDSGPGSGSSSSGGGGSGGSGGGNITATATASVSGGVVISVSVVIGGAGYTSQPSVCFVGAGTGAIAAATISGGAVISISVTVGGTGYSVAPTVTIAAPDVGGACSSGGGGSHGGGGGDAP
jgi:hypothetical protein